MGKYELIKSASKKIRECIYDAVWIDEQEENYMQKTEYIVERCIDELLKELVDNNIIKFNITAITKEDIEELAFNEWHHNENNKLDNFQCGFVAGYHKAMEE